MEEQFQQIPPKENTVNDFLNDPIEKELNRYMEDTPQNSKVESSPKEKKSNTLFYVLLSIIVILGLFGIIEML